MNVLTAPPSVDPTDPIASDFGIDDASATSFAPAPAADASTEPSQADGPTHYEIAAEAYTRYLERGAVDGHAVEDWLAAERTVLERRARRV